MVHAEKPRQVRRDLRFRAMREFVCRARTDPPILLQDFQIRVPRDSSQRQHRCRPQNLQFAPQIVAAIQNFAWQRLIGRRRAPHGCGNVDILKLQSIPTILRTGLIRESRGVQRLVQKIARAVAREHAPRAIRSVRGRSQSQDKQLRVGIAEARHAASPIIPFAVCPPLLPRHFLTVLHQPRAFPAGAYFICQNAQRRFALHLRPSSAAAISTA